MSTTVTEPLKPTQGPYYTMPSEGCFDILDANTNEVVAMAHEFPVAVLMASSSELLDGLIGIQEQLGEMRDDEQLFEHPKQARRLLHERIDAMEIILSQAFAKIAAEAGG